MNSATRTCRRCGNVLAPGGSFCAHCGDQFSQRIVPSLPSMPGSQRSVPSKLGSQTRGCAYIFIGAIAVLAVAVWALALTSDTESPSTDSATSGGGTTRLSLPVPETVSEWFEYQRNWFSLLNEDLNGVRVAASSQDRIRFGDLCYALTGDTDNLRLVPSPDAEVQAALDSFLRLIDEGASQCQRAADQNDTDVLEASTGTFTRAATEFEHFKSVLAGKGVTY